MWGLNTRDMSINAAPVLEAAWNRELLRCKWLASKVVSKDKGGGGGGLRTYPLETPIIANLIPILPFGWRDT